MSVTYAFQKLIINRLISLFSCLFIYNLSGCLHCKSCNLCLNAIQCLLSLSLDGLSGTFDRGICSSVRICKNLI